MNVHTPRRHDRDPSVQKTVHDTMLAFTHVMDDDDKESFIRAMTALDVITARIMAIFASEQHESFGDAMLAMHAEHVKTALPKFIKELLDDEEANPNVS